MRVGNDSDILEKFATTPLSKQAWNFRLSPEIAEIAVGWAMHPVSSANGINSKGAIHG